MNSDLTKFIDYRCLLPNKRVTNEPWFPSENVCPCNLSYNNISGRGYLPCTFGISEPQEYNYIPLKTVGERITPYSYKNTDENITNNNVLTGSLFNQNQYVPPQLDPRQLTLVGYTWRS